MLCHDVIARSPGDDDDTPERPYLVQRLAVVMQIVSGLQAPTPALILLA